MQARSTDALRSALLRNARPGLRPQDVLQAVRREHPAIPRNEIVRAALLAMIEVADGDPTTAAALHRLALSERGGADWAGNDPAQTTD